MGSGHRGTLLFYAVLIVGTSASALYHACRRAAGAGWPVLAAWIAAIGALFAGIDYHWRRRTSEQQ